MARVVGRHVGSFYPFPRYKLWNNLLAGCGIVIRVVLGERSRTRLVEDDTLHVRLEQRYEIRL